MKILESIAAFFAFLASLVTGVIFPGQSKEAVSNPFAQVKAASIYLSSETSFPTVGDEFPIDINLNTDGVNISAAAMRIVYKYISVQPIIPIDADSEKDGVQADINVSLLDNGWVFPVNEVVHDKDLRLITIDLAAVNLNPEGYSASDGVKLATIDTIVAQLPPKFTFNFDKNQTKIISKEGDELKLQLKSGEFRVR